MATVDLTALMRQILFNGAEWNSAVYIAAQDIKTAFDSIPHDLIERALLGLGAIRACFGPL